MSRRETRVAGFVSQKATSALSNPCGVPHDRPVIMCIPVIPHVVNCTDTSRLHMYCTARLVRSGTEAQMVMTKDKLGQSPVKFFNTSMAKKKGE